MKSSKPMEKAITAILARLGLTHETMAVGEGLRLEVDGPDSVWQPLEIKKIGLHRMQITHYRSDDPTYVDLRMVFSTYVIPGLGWIPTECRTALGTSHSYATYGEDDTIARYNPQGIASINGLAQIWGQNLHDQGWVARGAVVSHFGVADPDPPPVTPAAQPEGVLI